MTHKDDEMVLVVPTTTVYQLFGNFQGVCTKVGRWTELLEFADMRRRGDMETDPNFKQLIPYCLLKHGDRYFVYRRATSGAEQRLHHFLALGVGGHINPCDFDLTVGVKQHQPSANQLPALAAYEHALKREVMQEELELHGSVENLLSLSSVIGLVNTDDTEVGRVHLGVVHKVQLSVPEVSAKHADLDQGHLMPIDEIKCNIGQFEPWSRLIIEAGLLFAV